MPGRKTSSFRSWPRIALAVAAAIVTVALLLLVYEIKQPPRSRADGLGPLTDIGKRMPAPDLHPAPRPPALARDVMPERRRVLPHNLPDPVHPPNGTPPLATAGAPIASDPFVEPEIAQDPNRGGRR